MTRAAAIQVQAHVLNALLVREARIGFGGTWWGYLWVVLQPAVVLTALVLIFNLLGRHAPFGPSLALFFGTGVLMVEFYSRMSASLTGALTANAHLAPFAVVKPMDSVMARWLLVSTVHGVIAIAFFSGAIWLSGAAPPADLAQMVAAYGILAAFCLFAGLWHALIFSAWRGWRFVERMLARPVFFISGVFYIPSLLPEVLRNILWFNPLLHLVEMMRSGLYGNYHSTMISLQYLGLLTLGLGATGLLVERISRGKRGR
ncbi:ABC transporter permease [Ketogulonicigenium vulgare]|uniref:Putative cell surface polysaccharide export ABC-2 transporter permease protein n=1 Tax=Ketogulonicigenium vulgare (strain WSH-001) TaxID=759362 RepID=F9Y818_KETVW|nr:ABC transporter permease [Ketogulonicigenium vulgare]ADO42957.1 ABC-2 type transporter [Ketogulonicigenium vulgare Y25]AEM41144.1 putative cell surface polysaccharide export ABC-2 transporter permease protein [Ketogulonicigenium vulgare WSH-001]ALJ81282.1 sugar ABC transporter permease [Ketogulonicigenium vulgare]ANW34021.1 sugar ABC transporter permease [Ketogulonicigenium vulgare]AOZ54866.1 ABC transporter [Ketogulonicigenium vulgare]